MIIDELKKAILELIPQYPDIKRVVLFGSLADGTYHEGSDVDLIMEFSQSVSLLTLSAIKIHLEDRLNAPVDIIHGPMRPTDLIEINEEIELYAA